MTATGTADGDVTVGVVGDETLATAVEAVGASAAVGDATAVVSANPDYLLAAGDDAAASLARIPADRPVLAVGAGPGLPTTAADEVEAALANVLDGGVETTPRLVFDVAVAGHTETRALRDVMLVSDVPAHIAEFSVRSGENRVARFRADGVVVATPAGSPGYARDAGGPVVEPGTGTASAVPVAPFVTDADHWVLDASAIQLRVERDVPVALVADGRKVGTISTGEPVELSPGRPLELLAPGGDWKNSNGERTE